MAENNITATVNSLGNSLGQQNVLICLEMPDSQVEALQQVSPLLHFTRKDVRDGAEVPADIWATTDILYTSFALPPVGSAPHLKWVQTISAGVDHVVANPLFADPGVLLTTSSGIHARPITEYVFAMILAFARKIPLMLKQAEKQEWPSDRYNFLMPRELSRATLGIVGFGAIGREVARIAKAFGMQVLATKRNLKHSAAAEEKFSVPATQITAATPVIPDQELADRLYPPEALGSMLSACDFVVVLLPLTPQTENMIDATMIGAMKKTAVLINVGRGGVVDEDALIRALQNRDIGGAALDVFKQEPLPISSPLWKLDNVILSPHLAGNTDHYLESANEVFTENLRRYLNRAPLLNRADHGRGY